MENELNIEGKEKGIAIVYAADELSYAYEREVLERNQIPGLLPLTIEWIDDTAECHYDTEGCQSLELYYRERKITLEEFQTLMKSIREILAQMEEYLLDPGGIALSPNRIFIKKSTKKIVFCYLFGLKENQEEESQILMDWITRKIDYSDKELVLAVYGIKSGDLESADACHTGAAESSIAASVTEEVLSYSEEVKEESVNGSAWRGILTKIHKWFTLDESKNKGKKS